MFSINGSVSYNEIDYQTNSFEILHQYDDIKSISNGFSLERDGKKIFFRPANVSFFSGRIKVSIGSFRIGREDKIFYSFGCYKKESEGYYSLSNLYSKLRIFSKSILSSKMIVIGVCPGRVSISSSIPIEQIQEERVPVFSWEEPDDNGAQIVGYYYSFNQIKDYFVSSRDLFTTSKEVSISFPFSGEWFFHIRAVNVYGNFSRTTSTIKVIYNSKPSTPIDLRFNFNVFSESPISQGYLSWIKSENEDGDNIAYDLEVLKEGSIFYTDRIEQKYLSGKSLFCKINVINDITSNVVGFVTITEGNNASRLSSKVIVEKNAQNYDPESISINYGYFPKSVYSSNIVKEGEYSFRVKASDWMQSSPWSNFSYFRIENISKGFFGKVTIPLYKRDKGFVNKLFIRKLVPMFGKLFIFPTLSAKLFISESLKSDLQGKLFIRQDSLFYCKVIVLNKMKDFFCKLRVKDVYGSNDLRSKLIVIKKEENVLNSKLTVKPYSFERLSCRMFVIGNGYKNLTSKLSIIRSNFSCKAIIIRSFYSRLFSKVNILNRILSPVISSDVGNEWQNNNIVNLFWVDQQSSVQIKGYGYLLTKIRKTDDSVSNFINTSNKNISFDLDDIDGTGEYFFYLYSKGMNGSRSELSEYIIRYNNKPSQPGKRMEINGIDSLLSLCLISSKRENVFAWTRSEEIDFGDIVYYNIEISKKTNFSEILFNISNILDNNVEEFAVCSLKLDLNEGEVYYWRVRSYDGKQFSDYSNSGSFVVNTAPGVPKNLQVYGGSNG